MLRRVNELLLAGDSLNDFATAMLARLRWDGSQWQVVLASAGHPPAVMATAAGAHLLGGGTVLGAWQEVRIERHERPLEETGTWRSAPMGGSRSGRQLRTRARRRSPR